MRPDVALGVVVGRLLDAAASRATSGSTTRQQPGLVEQLEAAARAALGQDLHDLVADALGGDVGAASARRRAIAARVAGSIAKPKRAAKRTARSMRRRSSAMRAPASPIARMTPARRSACAADEVDDLAASSGSWKSALMVKSRRARPPRPSRSARRSVGGRRRRRRRSGTSPPRSGAPCSSTRITPNCAPTGDGAAEERAAPPRAARWSRRRSRAARGRAGGRARSRRRGRPRGRRRAAAGRRQPRSSPRGPSIAVGT